MKVDLFPQRSAAISWKSQLRDDPLPWLLETEDPGARYLTLRDLLARPPTDRGLVAARRAAHTKGQIAAILSKMKPPGYWAKPGPGYSPKYRSTVWSVITLAQLGASIPEDKRLARASCYLLDHALTPAGQFTHSGAPSGTIDCLQGNLCWALLELGCEDPRIDTAFEWMARTVTGEGLASQEEREAPLRYFAGKCGPTFACGANNRLPCAWGATKVMLAFGRLPAKRRTPLIRRAIGRGVDFLFSVDPSTAAYPCGWSGKPSRSWWKFSFPVFYVTDILQVVEALVALGYGRDQRLANALALVREKEDSRGRWPLEYDYTGKCPVSFGARKLPSKWVTLRALRVLKRAD